MRLWEWLRDQWTYDPPPGYYPSEKVWTVDVEYIYALGTTHYYEEFSEDHLITYIACNPVWNRAEWKAKDYADRVRKSGFKVRNSREHQVHFPVHRVVRVTVTASVRDEDDIAEGVS